MTTWMLLVGVAMLALASHDVVVTTISTTSAGGPVTSRFGRGWWRVAHRLARRPTSPWLSTAGPTILLGTIGLWLLLIWGGWTLVFAADASAVVSSTNQLPADWWSRVYFAVSQRAQFAARLDVMGGDAYRLVVNLFHDGSVAQFGELLPELTDRVLQTGERHLAYPVLHYFHPRSVGTELRVQLAALDDAITLVQFGLDPDVVRPHPAVLQAARSAIAHLIEQAKVSDVDQAPPLGLAPLRAADVPVVADETFRAALAGLEEHRRQVAGYAAESKWERPAV